MADYRRSRIEGGTYFFTVVTHGRSPLFADVSARELLGDKLRECREAWPFEIDAIVLLPDHLHAIWTLPRGDSDYGQRWAWIKKEFTKAWLAAGGAEQPVSEVRRDRGDRGVWQPRFWEHAVEDEHDFDRHFDYVHYNPVKHGLASSPADWPHSSFRRWVARGVYDEHWGRTALTFDDLAATAGEP